MDTTPAPRPAARLDGNLLAGPLTEVFAAEVTTAVVRCGGCGHSCVLAELVVYGPGPGLVGRCPGCADVMLRLVRTPEEVRLDLSGIAVLTVVPAPSPSA